MTLLLLTAIALAVAVGVYLALSRDLFRVVVGLGLLGAAVNLVVFTAGRLASPIPPLLGEAARPAEAAAADPLVQALVLTAVVISFALLCFALVLGATLADSPEGADVDQGMQAVEPPPRDPVKPAELDR